MKISNQMPAKPNKRDVQFISHLDHFNNGSDIGGLIYWI